MSAAIEISNLFRVYSTPEGDAAALQGLSLTVREGEVVTVLGPSGSGKTTLLRILAGLDRPSAGGVRVFDLEPATLSGRKLAAYRSVTLGYLEQHYSRALAPELTARQLVALQLGLAGAATRERLERADALLERVGLFDRRHAYRGELSGGEQQRVAVCAALAHRPRLLLADEPTGELDSANARLVYRLIGELLREEGCTAVVVSHDPGSAAIADRIVRIRDGRLAGETAKETGGEEAIVVGQGGWLRLPEELLLRAGIRSRARAGVEQGRLVLVSADAVPAGKPEAMTPLPRAAAAPRDGVVAEARALAKTFGRGPSALPVFADLNAMFAAGRLHVVTGPSGSGKTTLLHLLAGLDLPTAGEVAVLGKPISRLDRRARARVRAKTIALVRQEPGLIAFLGARENIELALAVRGAPAASARARALEVLEAVGLADRMAQRVARLSAGEAERVAIARALAARPALLLADEPTSRLDQANALTVATLLARLARESGTAIVCATHDPLVIEQADEELALDGR